MILFYLGVIFSTITILSIYPLFQQPDWRLALFFASLTLLSIYYFVIVGKQEGTEKKSRRKWSMLTTLYFAGLIVVLQGIGLWLYVEIFSRWQEMRFLTPIFKALFTLFKIPVGIGDGKLYINGVGDYIHTFLPNAGNLGLVYFLLIVWGCLSLLFIATERKKAFRFLTKTILSLILFMVIRSIFLFCLFNLQQVGEYHGSWYYLPYFWHNLTVAFIFIPWAFTMKYLTKHEQIELLDLEKEFRKESFLRSRKTSLSFGLFIVLTLLLLFWVPSGAEKQGRILMEEYHSDWSKSTKPFDEEWYNAASTYNYYTLRNYLNAYYDVFVNEKPLEGVDFQDYDVVILKIPTKPYSNQVMERLVAYVAAGGGLWVIGDHTNVFGSSTILNPLLKHFGIKLRYDGIYHNVHGSFNSVYPKTIIKHPIMYDVPVFLFATPCSLQVTNPAMKIVIPGLTTKSYVLSYANRNYFSDTKPDLNINFGANTLLTAGNYGRGRVAVFSDSTVFSNFFIYLPGKTELALSIIAWLNHTPPAMAVKLVLFVGALLSLFGVIYSFKKERKGQSLFWPTITGFVFFVIGIFLINVGNVLSFQRPIEQRPMVKAGFLAEYSSIYLPYAEWRIGDPNDFNTFYIWGQRVGICNRYYQQLGEALDTSKALFMILPKNPFTPEDIGKLDNYLQAGGKIFLLDHGGNGSTANIFLENYDLSLLYHEDGKGNIIDCGGESVFKNTLPLGFVKGSADPILYWRDEYTNQLKPVFVKKRIGRGELYLFGGVENFSTPNFGPDGMVPEGNSRKINDLILEMYRLIL